MSTSNKDKQAMQQRDAYNQFVRDKSQTPSGTRENLKVATFRNEIPRRTKYKYITLVKRRRHATNQFRDD